MSGQTWLMLLIVAAAIAATLTTCEPRSPSPNDAPRAAGSRPAALPQSAPVSAPSAPASSQSQPESSQSQPASQPIDALPKTPDFLAILGRVADGKRVTLDAQIEPNNTLRLTTENVERIRLTRKGLPLPRDRSVAVIIDQQGIEWTSSTDVVELERSPGGTWNIIRAPAARP